MLSETCEDYLLWQLFTLKIKIIHIENKSAGDERAR